MNVRVYGCAVKDSKLLVLEEMYNGEKLVKLPGGGLEFGEGTLECLSREFAEELSLRIRIVEHFYTQEDFVVSRFRESEQLLTVYYLVEILNESELKILENSIQNVRWIELQESAEPLPLPVDALVYKRLCARFAANVLL